MAAAVMLVLLIASPPGAYAQATRTWVSGVGDDANPCSRTAPCKTFAGAISKTAAGGEISVLDPGGYGAVTITKSLVIDGSGQLAGILASGTNGVVINAGVNDTVTLRHLTINGAGSGIIGIKILQAKNVYIDGVEINGFTSTSANTLNGSGISIQSTSFSQVFINNSVVNDNSLAGIYFKPNPGPVNAVINNTTVENNGFGIAATDNSYVAVRNSTVAHNSQHGVVAFVTTDPNWVQMTVENSTMAFNSRSGLRAVGTNATVRVGNSTLYANVNGMTTQTGGTILSFGTNQNDGNGTNGSPSSTVARQ